MESTAYFKESGAVDLLFNMDIYVAPEIDGFLMRAKVQKPTVRSLEKNEIDLNQFLEFTLLIADKELVVDPTYYGFEVEIVSFTAD